MFEMYSPSDAESDREWVDVQEKRAAVIKQCEREGHHWGNWRADLNDQLFRCCCVCGTCDDTARDYESKL